MIMIEAYTERGAGGGGKWRCNQTAYMRLDRVPRYLCLSWYVAQFS